MTIGSPHLYRAKGQKSGVPVEIIEAALSTAYEAQSQGLPAVLTLGHLSHLSDVKYSYLRNLVSGAATTSYNVFSIQKKHGGKRFICVPNPLLKQVQNWIQESILSRTQPHWRSFAYTPGSSVVACAAEHCYCNWLIKIDIANFFESISEMSVYSVFRSFGYSPLISFEMTRICTRIPHESHAWQQLSTHDSTRYKAIPHYRSSSIGSLPQGAPTSPMLANLACNELDEKLFLIAKKGGLVYTRYADDLTFSTAAPAFDRRSAGQAVNKIYRALTKFGLSPNKQKTKVVPPGSRKIVLGLLVDREQPRLTKRFRHNLENHARGVRKFGLATHVTHRNFDSIWGFIRHIRGLISYANMVDPGFSKKMKSEFSEAFADIENTT